MILPSQNFTGNSKGEDFFWSKCCLYLPHNYVSFHNYDLNLRQVDCIMLVPEKGILIIEIKGYLAKNIIDVPDNNTIRRKNNPADSSPYAQASNYRYKLINEFLHPNGINSVYVIPAVCYPFICEADFEEKQLFKISRREITILQEDLASSDAMLQKITSIFDFAYDNISNQNLQKNGFLSSLFDQVGNLICRDYRNAKEEKPKKTTQISLTESIAPYDIPSYSELVYSNDSSNFTPERIEYYIRAWMNGTKLQLFSSSKDACEKLISCFKEEIKKRKFSSLPDKTAREFEINEGRSFRLEIGEVQASSESFFLKNGEGIDELKDKLLWLDKNSSFNYGQYCMEHAPLENVIVKAGAGTGKTFSLISRINYLIWKRKYTPEELSNKIAMITFTNDSANQMKESLTRNFVLYFFLTRKTNYLAYIEAIADTQISTIDALARAILSKYAIKMGLGVNFRIATGTYERSLLMRQALDKYLSSNPNAVSEIPMSMFHFEQRLIQLMDKLDNKNLDLINDYRSLDFGHGEKQLPTGILDVVRDVQQQQDDGMKKNNAICLGDLIRKLSQLANNLHRSDLDDKMKVEYLFIDEFQDTDDVQIELIHKFQTIIGFKYFVVGDTKQSIYRFRGAEEKAFEKLESMRSDITTPIYNIALRKNYRTDNRLLNRMNTIFCAWDSDRDLDYQGDDILTGTKAYTSHPIFDIRKAAASETESVILEAIKEAQEKAKEFDGIVAILVRFNAQIREIQRICTQNKISVSTDVGGELFSSDPTIDLYKLLMALRYNQSSAHLYNLYTTSFVQREMPKLKLVGMEEEELVRYFYSNPPITDWEKYLNDLRTEPILKVLQAIIQKEKPWDIFAIKTANIREDQEKNRDYYVNNLDQLFENLIKIANTEYLTLNKITDYLDLMIMTRQEEDAREPFGADATDGKLLCTTIHKAKGAEYDTVILPFCNFDITGEKDRGFVDLIYEDNKVGYRILDQGKKEAYTNSIYTDFMTDEAISRRHEETRILYVALTRAKRAIYCITPKKDRNQCVTWSIKLKEGQPCES